MVTPTDNEQNAAHQGVSGTATRGRHLLVLLVTVVVLAVSLVSTFYRTAVNLVFIPVFLLLVAFCVISSMLVMRKALGES